MYRKKEYLARFVKVIKDNSTFTKRSSIMIPDIKDIYLRYHDPKIFVELSNIVTTNENMKIFLKKNYAACRHLYTEKRAGIVDMPPVK